MRPYSPIRSRRVLLAAVLTITTLLSGLGPSSPAHAANGVLEINQTCATQTGCFPGDTPGYPVTITGAAGRNYRLSSDLGDLGVGGFNTTVIEIAADHTTIDLAGFRIFCTTSVPPATPQPCSATGSGTGSGIAVDTINRTGVEVRNGSIFGMTSHGVDLGDQCVIRDLRVSEAGAHGIRGRDGCIIAGNTASDNSADGINAGNGSTVSGNMARSNGDDGIQADVSSTVSGNTASNNVDDGIDVGSGSTVSGNTVSSNGDAGIFAFGSGLVQRNTVRGNSLGLTLFGAAYRANVITNNGISGVTGGLNRGDNYCVGTGVVSASCP